MTHELRNYVAKEGYVEPVITGGPGTEDQDLYHEIRKYPNGVVQPAVLCIKPDATVLYKWHIIPAEVCVLLWLLLLLCICTPVDVYGKNQESMAQFNGLGANMARI